MGFEVIFFTTTELLGTDVVILPYRSFWDTEHVNIDFGLRLVDGNI
jgi:hypothetical protein